MAPAIELSFPRLFIRLIKSSPCLTHETGYTRQAVREARDLVLSLAPCIQRHRFASDRAAILSRRLFHNPGDPHLPLEAPYVILLLSLED